MLFALLLMLVLFAAAGAPVHAEGSRDLVESGKGNRPYIEWAPGTTLAGIERKTTLYTYAKPGETIYLGSSVAESYNADSTLAGKEDIVVTDPDGRRTALDVKSTGSGLIDTLAKEKAGPKTASNTGGYTPLSVEADSEGWWKIEFHGTTAKEDPKVVKVNDNFPTGTEQKGTVAAWDITVTDSSRTPKEGRTFSYYLSLNMGGNGANLYSKLFILTKDGFQYETDLNGIDPYGFGFFSNNRGFTDSSGKTLYHSSTMKNSALQGGIKVQDPTLPDTETDKTHRIFFNVPSSDLPGNVPTEPRPLADITDGSFRFTGKDTEYPSASPGAGGEFSFEAGKSGTYQLVIDTNRDGSFNPASDRVLENTFGAGTNRTVWDGKDRAGTVLPEGRYNAKLIIKGGEYHFPMLDVESANNGIKIKALNQPKTPALPAGVNESTIYWDDTNYTTSSGTPAVTTNINLDPGASQLAASPRDATAGQDSSGGSRGFTNNYGDQKAIDTWTYFPGPSYSAAFTVKPAVSGLVFVDLNKNGAREAGEPGFVSAKVTITGADKLPYPVITDENGAYRFSAGSGSVNAGLSLPDGYRSTTGGESQTVVVTTSADATFAPFGIVDDTPPAAPVVVGIKAATDTGASSSDRITANRTPVFYGTAEAGSTVVLYDTDGTTVLGSTRADDSGKWEIRSSALANGEHSVSAKSTDAARNTSARSNILSLLIDTQTFVTIDRPVNGAEFADKRPEFRGSMDRLTGVAVSIDGAAAEQAAGWSSAGFGSWTYTPASDLSEGPHTLKAVATDTAGNVDEREISFTVLPAPAEPAEPSEPSEPSEPVISGLIVSGADSLPIPKSGETDTASVYTAAYKETPETAPSEEIVWSLKEPAAGVEIDESTGKLTVTDAAQPGSVEVVASLKSDSNITGSRAVTLSAAPPAEVFASLSGTVYSSTGGIVPGVTVRAETTDGSEQSFDTVSGANGGYAFDKLPAGSYAVSVRGGGRTLAEESLTLSDRPEIRDLHLAELAAISLSADPDELIGDGLSSSKLRADVTDKVSGDPVENLRIGFSASSGELSASEVLTNGKGIAEVVYTAPKLDSDQPKEEKVRLVVRDYKSGIFAEKEITIKLLPPSINGVVTSGGVAIPNAVVKIAEDFDNNGTIDFTAETVTGADGSYHIAVPRGSWKYTLHISAPISIGGRTETIRLQQRSDVGALNKPNEEVPAIRQISGKLFVQESEGLASPFDGFVQSGGVSGSLYDAKGAPLSKSVDIETDGSYRVDDVQPGTYRLLFKFKAPSGDTLAGVFKEVTVDQEGQLTIEPVLIDPYGVVTDSATGAAITGVDMRLYWADTPLNRSQGRTPGARVDLPELKDFAPNQNHNPQSTVTDGSYAWMVYENGDYYIRAAKTGYDDYDSRIEKRNRPAAPGEDSWIENGIIHVGQTIVQYDLKLTKSGSSPGVPSTPGSPAAPSTPASPGGASSGTGAAPAAKVPAAPIKLSLKTAEIGGSKLTWQPADGADYYRVYQGGVLTADNVKLPEYWLAGLEAGQSYTFRVSAVSAAGESPLSEEIAWTAPEAGSHIHYIFGYPDGTFRPARSISRAEMAAIMTRIMIGNEIPAAESLRYADVPASHWAAGYADRAASLGVMNGLPGGAFQPDRAITRGELAAILVRFRNLEPAASGGFSDTAGHWAEGDIGAAARAGLLKGYPDGTYRPNAPISRAELVTAVNRMLGRGPLLGNLPADWPDAPVGHWAYRDIMEASLDHDYAIQSGGEYRSGP
ncbi:S-layer homology domain-containing protein [Saccharibacillus sp. CPCC 101409]|uniref:S-layer homology domain-containing protein n=1 Tax=Saccharibacillus sp. CPCC 101409 TaxID=3058041 RepID=UPI0026727909|nr:S-layer homology domain-containing protein [Saccharibacillus sp. CPCC 101409]MDO3410003.1 S-layer homology domain-containing protein [Saccharibacillus sp. CPCC 101409]